MSAAEIINYKNSPSKSLLQLVREDSVIVSIESNEDSGVTDQSSSSPRASNRRFLAEAPAVVLTSTDKVAPSKPELSQDLFGQLLTNAKEFFRPREEGDTAESRLASLQKMFPALVEIFSGKVGPNGLANAVNNPSTEPTDKKTAGTDKLFEYLTMLMLFQVRTSKDQSTLVQMNQTISNGGIEMSKAAGVQATDALNKYLAQVEQEKEDAQNQSIWSIVMGCALVLGGFLSGDPVMVGMGVLQLVMQIPLDSNGTTLNSKLNDALADVSPALQVIIPLAIAIVETALLCGAGALAESALSSVGKEGAEFAGSGAASVGKEVATDAAANAGETVGAAVVKDLASTQQTVVTQGIRSTAKEIAKSAEKSTARRMLDVVKALKVPQLMMLLSSGQFWPTVCKQIAEDCTSDPDEQEKISQWLSATIMIVTMVSGAVLGSAGGGFTNWTAKISGVLGESGYQAVKNSLRFGEFLSAGIGAGWGIDKGVVELKQETTLTDQAIAREMVAFSQGFIDRLQGTLGGTQETFKKVYEDFAAMNQNADRFLDAYDPRNYTS
jgi:hypothetical protein